MDLNHQRKLYWNIANKLVDLRWQKRLKQAELAERCGLSRSQIGRIEQATGEITLESLHKLAQFFEIPISEFFTKRIVEPVTLKIRPQRNQKVANGSEDDIYFARVLHNSPKFRRIRIPSHTHRHFKITKEYFYDLFVMSGEISVQANTYGERLQTGDIATLQGTSQMALWNPLKSAAEILLIQAVADEVFDDRGVGKG